MREQNTNSIRYKIIHAGIELLVKIGLVKKYELEDVNDRFLILGFVTRLQIRDVFDNNIIEVRANVKDEKVLWSVYTKPNREMENYLLNLGFTKR